MKDCCFKNIDKAIRKGRAHYICSVCESDVSLMWAFYQQALEDSNCEEEWDARERLGEKPFDKPKWEKEFDKLVEMPENLGQAKNSLYGEDHYPESPFELSEFKLKDFIKQVIQDTLSSVVEKITKHQLETTFTSDDEFGELVGLIKDMI